MKLSSIRTRHALTLQLTAVICITLIVFVGLTGVIYNLRMKETTIEQYSRFLHENAFSISQNLHDLLAPEEYGQLDETRLDVSWDTLAPYLAMTEQITRSNVYIVDAEHRITGSFDGIVQTLDNVLLPAYLEQSIAYGFMGKTPSVSEGDGESMRLTTSAPVMNAEGRVLGVVLLDTTLRELGYTQISGGTIMLASALLAFVAAVMFGFALSFVFNRPIDRIRGAAQALAGGRYEARLPTGRNNEIGQLARSMNTLAEKLEDAQEHDRQLKKRQQQFFSEISHELRTPVTVIRGSVEALSDGIVTDQEQVRATYRQILTETEGLQGQVAELLELSRLQDPDFAIEKTEISLNDLLGDVAMSAATLCARKGVQFVCEEPGHDRKVYGDYQRLRQMLMAVADNAVKFTPAGRAVMLSADPDTPCVTVRDEGIGISDSEKEHLFDRFYHARSRDGGGTGLGLALVREIANRHHIDIVVESSPEQGTAFRFIFRDPDART